MKTIKRWLVEAFGFTKTEMNGIGLLLVLILLVAILPRMINKYSYLNAKNDVRNEAELLAWAEKVSMAIKIKEDKKPEWTKANYAEKKNSYSKSQYNSNKNKKFDVIEKYEERKKYSSKPKYEAAFSAEKKLNLNKSTEDDLQKINGIGPVLSQRIIKYRDFLGGFSSSNQLNEVYGLKPEMVSKLTEITFANDSIKKIDFNSDSIKYLISHPYINYKLAKTIINYRKVHGDYTDSQQLLNLKLMSDSLYQKIYPYISVNQ